MPFSPLPAIFAERLARVAASGGLALDLGCGDGAFAGRLEAAGVVPVGLDRLPRSLARRADLRGDARRPPLRDRSLDLLTAANLLRHLAPAGPLPPLLERWQGLLRPGGALFLFEDEPADSPAAVRNYRDLQAFLARLLPGQRGPLLALDRFRAGLPTRDRWRFGLQENRSTLDPAAATTLLAGAGAPPTGEAARLAAAITAGGLACGRYWWAAWTAPEDDEGTDRCPDACA